MPKQDPKDYKSVLNYNISQFRRIMGIGKTKHRLVDNKKKQKTCFLETSGFNCWSKLLENQ